MASLSSSSVHNLIQAELPHEHKLDFYQALIQGDETLTNRFGKYFTSPITNSIEPCNADLPTKQCRLRCDQFECSSLCDMFRHCCQSLETANTLYPIHVVAAKGSVEVMEILLQQGADMYSLTQPSSYLPFDLAIKCRNYSAAERLLNHGFSFNSEKNRRKPKLKESEWKDFLDSWMASRWSEEIWPAVDLSVRAGYLFDESTWICCLLDVMRSTTPYPTVLRSMLNMRFLDDYTDYWEGPDGDELPTEVLVAFDVPKYKLMFAAGNEDAVNALFDCGLNPIGYESGKYRALPLLYHHLQECRLAVAEAILKRYPEALDQMGSTYLANSSTNLKTIHLLAGSIAHRCVDLMSGFKMLVRYGARINELTSCGETVLTIACSWMWDGHVGAVECIFDLGFNLIDHQNKNGDTALMLAAKHGNLMIVNCLLRHGANPRLSNKDIVTALWFLTHGNIRHQQPSDILPILYTNTPLYDFPNSPLNEAINKKDKGSVKALVSSGWYLNGSRSAIGKLMTTDNDNFGDLDFKKWIYSLVSKPPSLRWWAKRVIRRKLPMYPYEAVKQLPVPDKLKEFILMVVKLDAEQTEKLQKFEWLPPDYKSTRYVQG